MDPLKLLKTNLKLFKIFALEFSYEKDWKGLWRQRLFVCYMAAFILVSTMQLYYTIFRAESLAEITDCLSILVGIFYPAFRAICLYMQRKKVLEVFEFMKQITDESKLI